MLKCSLLILIFYLLNHCVFGQCPVTNSCTPGAAPTSAFPFGMGIYSVNIGSGSSGISNPTTGGASQGYQNYSCTQKATVLEGVSTSISVTTNQNANENVSVWLDLNNNGVFDNTTELIFSSVNAKVHTGSFTIPVSASVVKNTVLRLRVSADNFSSPLPTPCSTPQFSQVEDYGMTVLPNTNKPTVAFSVNNPVTCSPTLQFQNQTQNGAISYLWNFGDGTTSTAANPSHTYAATGTYTVKLKACNINGCDSLTRINYVTYHTNVPVAASCTPATLNYCCGYGITNFTLHTLSNASTDGTAGYEDFTCAKSVTLQEHATYPVSITTNTNTPQDIWIYIDYNNDGNFSANELTYSKFAAVNPTGNIVIKGGGTLNARLRMRVIADATGNTGNACATRNSGQAEDYTVILVPNTNKPFVNFSTDRTSACDSEVRFTDQSQNLPYSWTWDFGDGSPHSSQQNPTHVYNKSGVYTVKLTACNANGCDSISKTNFVVVNLPCPAYCIPSNYSNSNFITNVTFADLNHSSGKETTTYADYTNFIATVVKGNTYPISVSLSSYPSSCKVYIDYNQDGDFFDQGEYIPIGDLLTPRSHNIIIPTTAKVGLTRMRIIDAYSISLPCISNLYEVEVEDYSLNILPNNLPPSAAFFTNGKNSCSYTVSFIDSSSHTPNSWLWNFGDPASGASNTSALQNPTHKFSGPGIYTIALKTTNAFGSNTITKTNYIKVNGNNGPRSANCFEYTKEPQAYNGIKSVTFNTIDNQTPLGGGYQDYSCNVQTILNYGETYPIRIETRPSTGQHVRVWIDYNNNGKFDTINETAFTSNGQSLHIGDITPPQNAVVNKFLRMRVINEMVDKLPPSPCNPLVDGQAEDYAVKIYDPNRPEEAETTDSVSTVNKTEVKIYPNPNNGTFYIEIPSVYKDEFQIEVFNLIGRKVAAGKLENDSNREQVDLSYLSKGVYFVLTFNSEFSEVKKIVIN